MAKACKKCQKALDGLDNVCDECLNEYAEWAADYIVRKVKWYVFSGVVIVFAVGVYVGMLW